MPCPNCSHWKARALAAEKTLRDIEDRRRASASKRKQAEPRSPDAELIVTVCARFGFTRQALARRLGLADGSMLSRAQVRPLPAQYREQMQGWVESGRVE